MKKLIKKILSIICRPIINLLNNQNNILTDLLTHQNSLLVDLKQTNVLNQLQQNDYIFPISYRKRDLSERFLINFYVPDYSKDYIQSEIVDTRGFFDEFTLVFFDKYVKDNSVILDIGGNIGNHSLYWAIVRKAQAIHTFEPYKIVYDHICKHVEINNLENVITAHNKGVGAENTKAQPSVCYENMGGSNIKPSSEGNMEIVALDSVELNVNSIDLIKIDTEGHEYNVLLGAKNTISKYLPTIILEVYNKKEKDERYDEISSFLEELGYSCVDSIANDFIFIHKDKINN